MTIHYSQKDYTTLMDTRTTDNYNGRWRQRQRRHRYKSGMFFFLLFSLSFYQQNILDTY